MMLKNIYKSLLAVCLLCANTVSANQPNVEEQVLAAFKSLVEASRNLDSHAYFQHFDHNKFVGLNSDGTNWNSIDDLKPLIEGGFGSIASVNQLVFTNVRVSVIDTYTAILVNEYQQSVTLKSGDLVHLAGGGTQVWSKRSGQWKLVSVSGSNKP